MGGSNGGGTSDTGSNSKGATPDFSSFTNMTPNTAAPQSSQERLAQMATPAAPTTSTPAAQPTAPPPPSATAPGVAEAKPADLTAPDQTGMTTNLTGTLGGQERLAALASGGQPSNYTPYSTGLSNGSDFARRQFGAFK